MLDLFVLLAGGVLTIWQPIEARRVAGGWTRPRFRGTREEFLVAYRRQLTRVAICGAIFGAGTIALSLLRWQPMGASVTLKIVAGIVWLVAAAAVLHARRLVDAPPR